MCTNLALSSDLLTSSGDIVGKKLEKFIFYGVLVNKIFCLYEPKIAEKNIVIFALVFEINRSQFCDSLKMKNTFNKYMMKALIET